MILGEAARTAQDPLMSTADPSGDLPIFRGFWGFLAGYVHKKSVKPT